MKVFARIKNGKIIEYPVYEIHIKNRAHSVDRYTECIFDTKPEIPAFHQVREVLKISENKVYVSYILKAKTLEELLSSLRTRNIPGIPAVEVTIATIAKDFIDQVVVIAKKEVQDRLDAFATTDGFDDMKSLVGYKDSTIPEWSEKATRAILLRDQTWMALYNYLDTVMNGTEPVPKSKNEVFDKLPVLSW